jgi:hypothetical protein
MKARTIKKRLSRRFNAYVRKLKHDRGHHLRHDVKAKLFHLITGEWPKPNPLAFAPIFHRWRSNKVKADLERLNRLVNDCIVLPAGFKVEFVMPGDQHG